MEISHSKTLTHQVLALFSGNHYDPHTILGLHYFSEKLKVIRIWRPGANSIFLEVSGKLIEPQKIHEAGLFECYVPLEVFQFAYQLH